MGTYFFQLDEKCTVWKRTQIQIEADSKEDAIKLAVINTENSDFDELPWDDIENTTEKILPIENDGQSTVEVYDLDGYNLIFQNGRV